MAGDKHRQLNRQQIEASLKSATDDLIPNVLDRIDLNTPQIMENGNSRPSIFKRQRVIAGLIAACFCMIMLAGGTYSFQNSRVDSVIGIDVNPSVELSVNKKNRVLKAEAVNADGKTILKDMDLEGIDLNVAVNAIIGSLVTHGFLDDLDNAILVTVSNDSIKKATNLRSAVVSDIRTTLEEKRLKAVVYDQQVIEEDDVKQLARQYDISYGKAYFLKELIAQNSSLSMNDMEELAPLTMEEIAKVITERSYAVGAKTEVSEDTKSETQTSIQTTEETTTRLETESVTETTPETTTAEATSQVPVQTPATQPATSAETTAVPPTTEDVVTSQKIKIDYVDYENGLIMVHFITKVKWKNPTVSVKDGDGTTYSSKIGDTDSDYCEINVSGLEGGVEYTFVLGGISPKSGRQTTVKGVFETPVIGDGEADDTEPAETEPAETDPTQANPTETKPVETTTQKEAETDTAKAEEKTTEAVNQEGNSAH
ncbi:hypothetical protein [Lacrimispora amygdalina]|uniref:anti-sigma-I factor RsgI family protein n=1 Tax=Lacrimispora amygdalina TaxID=253257 RepID=UPI000BE2414D|nr:hypothetical protein [Lacrimispora amygdalina]